MNVNGGLEVFDTTLRKTHEWLNDMMNELGWDDRQKAFVGLRASLQALRDRLTVAETVQLGAQLPALIRGFYYEGWSKPSAKPQKWHKTELLEVVRQHFHNDPHIDPEEVVRAAFRVVAGHVDAGELQDVIHILPKDLQALWPRVPATGR